MATYKVAVQGAIGEVWCRESDGHIDGRVKKNEESVSGYKPNEGFSKERT